MHRICTCDPAQKQGYEYIQWMGSYFGDCVYTPVDQISFYAGLVSLSCYLIALLPQFIKNFQRKNVEGLSLGMLTLWTFGDISNFTGTMLANQLPTQKLTGLYFLGSDVLMLLQYCWYRYWYPKLRRSGSGYQRLPTTHDRSESDRTRDDVNEEDLVVEDEREDVDSTAETVSRQRKTSTRGQRPGSPLLNQHVLISTAIIAAMMTTLSVTEARNLMPKPLPIEIPLCNEVIPTSETAKWIGTLMAWTSGSFYFFSRIPQLIENYTTKSVQGISSFLFILTVLANCLYGVAILIRFPPLDAQFYANTLPYLLGSIGVLVFDGILLFQVAIYRK